MWPGSESSMDRYRSAARWLGTPVLADLFINALLLSVANIGLLYPIRHIRDRLMVEVPVERVDFTSVLPRCISLFILSFLNPMELCKAAQVSWHWKFLTEQDCLWSDRCVRRGWFLPYTPSSRELRSWKAHYINCVSTLDYLTPREAAEKYGTLNQTLDDVEEKMERMKEHVIRQAIREKAANYKRVSLKSRGSWLSNSWTARSQGGGPQHQHKPSGMALTSSLVTLAREWRSQLSLTVKENEISADSTSSLEQTSPTTSMRSAFQSSAPHSSLKESGPSQSAVQLLLISSRIPAYELLLTAAHVSVVPVVYDYHTATLDLLLTLVERHSRGRRVQRIGLIAEGGTEEIWILKGLEINDSTVLNPDVREFWEKVSGWIVSLSEGGSIDIFLPLAASVSGLNLVKKISSLTGLEVKVPNGISTGSYQHILGEWLGWGESPPLAYFSQGPLLSWCWQAAWLEEALKDLREHLRPHFQHLRMETQGRILGQFLSDKLNLPDTLVNSEVTSTLTEGLLALSTERPEKPLAFLATFLQHRQDGSTVMPEVRGIHNETSWKQGGMSHLTQVSQNATSIASRRLSVVQELQRSECSYIHHLQAVKREYYCPLRAALDSNRAILSSANILLVFAPVLDILEVNSLFLNELMERVKEWSPQQGIGDICLKFCSKLWVYTNFFNNYPTILRTLDKCKERIPSFRSFLKRQDRTPCTFMLSLQELLLEPCARVEEYVTLLQALTVHTPAEHHDHGPMAAALNTLLNYRAFLRKLKKSCQGEERLQEIQRMIQSCPNLKEGNRHLIAMQHVVLLKCPDDKISASLRIYEPIRDLGLFLFNDALVLTERCVLHQPYSLAVKISHTFLASIALHGLNLEDITDTEYIKNAFLLESPKRYWICSMERAEDKVTWVSALKGAMSAAIKQQ